MNLLAILSTEKAITRVSRAPFTERGMLRLFVRGDSVFANLRESLAVLASGAPPRASNISNYFRDANIARSRFSGRPLGASFVLHCSLVALLIYLPGMMPAATPATISTGFVAERIYYRIPRIDPMKVPRLAPQGPGGRPGSGFIPARLPALGGTVPHPSMTVISKPIHADNARQTIFQPSSPPDLRMPTIPKLPNIVLMHAPKKPEAPRITALSRPAQVSRQIASAAAPAVNSNPVHPLMTALSPSETQPRLPIPLTGGGAPIRSSDGVLGDSAAQAEGDGPDLVALGVDPGGLGAELSLPAGSRWGEFSIGPHGGTPGSPGGDPGGVAGGGSGGGTTGGDGSTGIGSGGKGGGGNLSAAAPISIAGLRGGDAPGGVLDPALKAGMIFPVTAPAMNVRRNALVVSAGPIGGGGLSVYGALKCGKIYSIFLPMPKKNWSLEYCDESAGSEKVVPRGSTSVIHLDKPLIPPDFDLSHRFDFKRTPVPTEKSHRSIILKGVIAADGTIQHLIVYQGVTPEMDEAARTAFSRWHFKPAMKDGKPVEVEILVGIPPLAEEDRVNR